MSEPWIPESDHYVTPLHRQLAEAQAERDKARAQRDELARNMREMVDRCRAALDRTSPVPPKDE